MCCAEKIKQICRILVFFLIISPTVCIYCRKRKAFYLIDFFNKSYLNDIG